MHFVGYSAHRKGDLLGHLDLDLTKVDRLSSSAKTDPAIGPITMHSQTRCPTQTFTRWHAMSTIDQALIPHRVYTYGQSTWCDGTAYRAHRLS